MHKNIAKRKGIDYEETRALVARLDSIRMVLTFANNHNLTFQQMDVKSAFLNGYIMKEVYVKQSLGFKDPNELIHVYKLNKALYGLKQAYELGNCEIF